MAEHFSIGTAGTRVTLNNTSGFDVKRGWRPQADSYDDVFQESALADYRQLASYRDTTIIETIPLALRATSQDNAASQTQSLRQLLRTARNYWATTWQDDPVYLQLQGSTETNARYAIIHAGRLPDDQSVLSCWMEATSPTRAVMPDLNLIVERGPWLENAPGTGTAVELSALEAYDGRNLGNVDSSGDRDPTTSAQVVFVANKRNEANLTDVYVDDGGAFGANLMDAALPFDFLPAVPVVNDAVYFGIDTTVSDSGPFCSLVFDIATAQSGCTIAWEYWNAAWVALTVQDNTNADGAHTGDAFDATGTRSVHWVQPSDWATTAVNGVTGYWVRARVTAVSSPTPPEQQNRDIYSIVWPYVEIQAAQVDGDLPALARILLRQQSDPSASGSIATTARVIAGLRSLDRGSEFEAYLNASDEQNPGFITCGAGLGSAFASDVETPTGRKITCTNPQNGIIQARWDIADTNADDYLGRFHAFIRAQQTSGAAGTISMYLKTVMGGSAFTGPTVSTPYVSMQGTSAFEVLDMGAVMLPVSDTFTSDDNFSLRLEIGVDGDGAADCDIIDLILIPTDEWAIDAISLVDPSGAIIGLGQRRSLTLNTYLDIDSIMKPSSFLRSILRIAIDDYATTPWRAIMNGQCILRNNTTNGQRLWFFQLADTSLPYLGAIEKAGSIRAYKNQRYASMRGAS